MDTGTLKSDSNKVLLVDDDISIVGQEVEKMEESANSKSTPDTPSVQKSNVSAIIVAYSKSNHFDPSIIAKQLVPKNKKSR